MEPKTEHQSELIHALLNNNERVINQLYLNNYPKVEHYVLKNNGNKQDAKDVFQEAFMTLWKKVNNHNFTATNNSGVEGFIYQVAKNKWLDNLRSARYNKNVNYDERHENQSMRDVDNHIDSESHEKLDCAMAAFKNLGKDCQQLLTKFYFEKKSLQKIAEELALGTASARNKKYRCMQTLRELTLKNKGIH